MCVVVFVKDSDGMDVMCVGMLECDVLSVVVMLRCVECCLW